MLELNPGILCGESPINGVGGLIALGFPGRYFSFGRCMAPGCSAKKWPTKLP